VSTEEVMDLDKSTSDTAIPSDSASPGQTHHGVFEIQQWLMKYIAKINKIQISSIDIDAPFDTYAMNSVAALTMAGDLELWLGEEFDPAIVWDYPTIDKLSEHLSKCTEKTY